MSPRSAEIPGGAPWLAPILAVFSLGLSGLAVPSPAAAQTVVQHDFEDGTTQGWVPRGTAVVTNTTEAANTGTHSLKTTGRTAGFNGPALNLLGVLSPGTVYQVTVAVRLVSGEPATQLIVTVQRTPSGGSSQFDRVAASGATGVTDAGWVTLQGYYSFAGDVSGLLLYVESASPTASYYVDDFSIVAVPRRRLRRAAGHHRHPHELRDGHARGLGPAHRPRDGHGHECRRARRQLQPAHHRPPGGLRRRRDQRRRQAVQRLALRREPVGQAGAGAADVAAAGQHPAHASTASPTSTPSSRTRR